MSLCFVWVYASFWATLPVLGVGNYAPEPFGTSCTLDWWLAQASLRGKVFVLSIFFFCLLLPTVVIIFSYAKIIAKVKSSAEEVAHFDARNQNTHTLEIKLTKVINEGAVCVIRFSQIQVNIMTQESAHIWTKAPITQANN